MTSKSDARKSIQGFIKLARKLEEFGGLEKSKALLEMRKQELENALTANADARAKMTKDLSEVKMTLNAVNKAIKEDEKNAAVSGGGVDTRTSSADTGLSDGEASL